MTVETLDAWTSTAAFREYRRRHDASDVDVVVARTRRYLDGSATTDEVAKVESFVSRMKQVPAGPTVNGSGPTAVSDRSASLRNWGFDPTGRFVP
jgi:hypothetical protein